MIDDDVMDCEAEVADAHEARRLRHVDDPMWISEAMDDAEDAIVWLVVDVVRAVTA